MRSRIGLLSTCATLVLLLGAAATAAAAPTIYAAVLPTSRNVAVGSTATVFASIVNAGPGTASDCSIALPGGLPITFHYQTTDPATNAPTGTLDTPADVPEGEARSFVLTLLPTAVVAATELSFTFQCADAGPAPTAVGVNTLLFAASTPPPQPDIVALAGTVSHDGVVHVDGVGAFAVAAVNVGATGAITVTPDTGAVALPLTLGICETVPLTGACKAAVAPSVTLEMAPGGVYTFSIFVTANAPVALDALNNRIFVTFVTNPVVGRTSVAVEGAPKTVAGQYLATGWIALANCTANGAANDAVEGKVNLAGHVAYAGPGPVPPGPFHGQWVFTPLAGFPLTEAFVVGTTVDPAGGVAGIIQSFVRTNHFEAGGILYGGTTTFGILKLGWAQAGLALTSPAGTTCDVSGSLLATPAPPE